MNPKNLILLLSILTALTTTTSAQELLFYCSNSTGTFQVYSKNLTTNQTTTITSNSNFNYWWVEPSPDGTQLLLMRSPVDDNVDDQFDYDVCQMVKTDISGANEILMLDDNAYGWTAFGNPHWHPQGDKIIMLAQPTNEFFVFTIEPDGSNPIQLTTQFSIDPNWSHRGDKIVFIGINANPTPFPSFDDFEVFTADYNISNSSVSNIQQLTDDIRRDQDPCFSPDDSQIAFSSADNISLSVAQITVMDTLGNNRVDFVSDNQTNGGPVNWGANNKIYYHHVNFNVPPFTPFTAKEFDVLTNTNTDLFPSLSEGYISPFYFQQSIVGLEKLKEGQQVVVFPNPTAGIISFGSHGESESRITIYSVTGEEVAAFICSGNCDFDVSGYRAGIYFYRVLEGEEVFFGNFMKVE